MKFTNTKRTSLDTDRLKEIVDSIPYGVAVIDADWKVSVWNKKAKKITGYNSSKVIGHDLRKTIRFVNIQDKTSEYTFIENTFTTGKNQDKNESIVVLTLSNNEVPLSCYTSPLFNRVGTVNAVILTFRDLNEEKGAFRLRSDFNYLQHQLRTPLSSALWNLQMALESSTDKKTKDLIKISLNSIESIKLISNLLIEVSQVDQGLLSTSKEEVDPANIIQSAEASISELIKTRDINIKVNIKEATKIVTDPHYAARIIEEILKNAVLYSKPGDSVDITVRPESEGVLFEIKDRGLGIPTEENSLVFTKFFRGHQISNLEPGAGLGLYLTHRYVKLLQGRVWFISKQNEGSTFSVYLPNLHSSRPHAKISIDTGKIL